MDIPWFKVLSQCLVAIPESLSTFAMFSLIPIAAHLSTWLAV